MNFDQAFKTLMEIEGGYVNHPDDPGGETKYGITKAVARKHGYHGSMKDFPIDEAKRIYRVDYWDKVSADELPEPIRYPLFDAAVNSGVKRAVKWLQIALDDPNHVKPDGILGPITKLSLAMDIPADLAMDMIATRLEYLTNLSTWPKFGKGWARRIAKVLRA